MSFNNPLPSSRLYTVCDPSQFDFDTTGDLEDLTEIIGQSRASDAVQFGIGIQREGYNLYVMGPPGMGKHTMVRQFLEEKSAEQPPPPDWCYVNNFEQPHKPSALRLPPGLGTQLSNDMEQLIEELSITLPAVFESDEYRAHVQQLNEELEARQEKAFSDLTEEAASKDVKLFRTASGFAFAPMQNKEIITPDQYDRLPFEERKAIEEKVSKLQEKLQAFLQAIPQWRKETREKLKKLNREVTMSAVGTTIEHLRHRYEELSDVLHYLDSVEQDIVDNAKDFLKPEESVIDIGGGLSTTSPAPTALHRYKINVLVNNKDTEGAPVVYLDNPTYANLVGRTEHHAQFGTLVTDFTLIKPGALHESSGGYLMLEVRKILMQPYAWEGLKRALFANEVNVESLEKMLGLLSTASLEPEPIPLNTKVVLLGDRLLYYLLYEYDPEFAELFKVQADFEQRIERNDENNQLYARLIATVGQKELLRPLDREAVARVIEYSARQAEDAEKMSTHMRTISDLLREADYWASQNDHHVLCADDIQMAVEQQIHRASRIRETIREETLRGTIMIETEWAQIGQVNGLSVISMGEYTFGQPSRITATVHIGEGEVIDIEREVELGGALHSKGVLILSSFIAARFARAHPLSLSASLVFEQSYAMVEGDSASMAELCALLSALSEVPVMQSLAITGSVDQRGRTQAIGGVNEKIEGFFDICKARGLTGKQGVIIPESNVKHLMLKREVLEAATNGEFHIYAIANVDQALELLTAVPAGEADAEGNFPAESLNGKVHARLKNMAKIRHAFGEHAREQKREGRKSDESDQ
jgi:predicted ATP-dependent protease